MFKGISLFSKSYKRIYKKNSDYEQHKIIWRKKVRSLYDEQDGKWRFSIIDVIEAHTDSTVPLFLGVFVAKKGFTSSNFIAQHNKSHN